MAYPYDRVEKSRVPTVLLVEDSPQLRWEVSFYLRQKGYRVLRSRTAEHALASVRRRPPDAIIVDAALPRPEGLDLAGELQRQTEAPVLSISQGDAARLEELEAKIRRLIGRRKR